MNTQGKQGWFNIPVGPGQSPRSGYFVNGKMHAEVIGTFIRVRETETTWREITAANDVNTAKAIAEREVWK